MDMTQRGKHDEWISGTGRNNQSRERTRTRVREESRRRGDRTPWSPRSRDTGWGQRSQEKQGETDD